jgi:hypothetical protein
MNNVEFITNLRMRIAALKLLLRQQGDEMEPEQKAIIEKQIARLTYLISELE